TGAARRERETADRSGRATLSLRRDDAVTTGESAKNGSLRRATWRTIAPSAIAFLVGCHGPEVGPEIDPGDSGSAPSDTRDATVTPDADAGIDTNLPGTDSDAGVDTTEAGDPCIDPTGFG